jgi:hypothetical protein
LYKCFGADDTSFANVIPHEAKARREIISPMFSRTAIRKLEFVVQDKVKTNKYFYFTSVSLTNTQIQLLVDRLIVHSENPINMALALRSASLDIITAYCFAEPYGCLDFPDFRHPVLVGMQVALPFLFVMKVFPIIHWLLPIFPDHFVISMMPPIQGWLDLNNHIAKQVAEFMDDPTSLDRGDHETIYYHLLTSEKGRTLMTKKSMVEEGTSMRCNVILFTN